MTGVTGAGITLGGRACCRGTYAVGHGVESLKIVYVL